MLKIRINDLTKKFIKRNFTANNSAADSSVSNTAVKKPNKTYRRSKRKKAKTKRKTIYVNTRGHRSKIILFFIRTIL